MSKQAIAVPRNLQSLQSMPRQMSMTFDLVELQGMNGEQRTSAIKRLADLLIQAAGVAMEKESDDDER